MSGPDHVSPESPELTGRRPTVGVVTVTYNSGRFFPTLLKSIAEQTLKPDLVVFVDSGSKDVGFLDQAAQCDLVCEIVRRDNVGVCVGNNIGWRRVRDFDYVLFLNPDAFLTPRFLEDAVAYMQAQPSVGMVTPSLLRYAIEAGEGMNRIDTTGVVRGLWGTVERDHGKTADRLDAYTGPNRIPFVCTAVALGRRQALEAVVEDGDQLFDESFFMYKDDTDLSWRIRRAGWALIHHPGLLGYHCRGWQERAGASRASRLLSARNEVKMCLKNRSPFVLSAIVKYGLVKLVDL